VHPILAKFRVNLALCRRYDASLPRISSVTELARLHVCYLVGLLPFVRVSAHIQGIKIGLPTLHDIRRRGILAVWPDWTIRAALGLVRTILGPHPRMVSHLQQRGHLVWALVVNSDADHAVFAASGADALLTDRPEWARTLGRRRCNSDSVTQ